ncbi:MAG: long-chain fatty acid--CoA ligase [Terriglobia bacterium]|jgi:fatty-acyl-CoA synthase|nr:long-chain fatty acid--CoA ligase [Terriglobia bacterium]
MIAGEILGERVRITPNKVALVYVPTGERFTYSELNAHATACAAHFSQLGIQKRERVGILAQNCVEYIVAFFAAGKSGVILVPLNYRLTPHELEGIARDAGLKALLFEKQYAETANLLRQRCGIAKLISLEDLLATQVGSAAEQPCAPEDPWCLLYTSGTTGKPKGVVIPHRQILANARNTAESWHLRDTDIAPIITPLCHAGGLAVFLTPLFLVGGTIVLHRGFDASEVWRTLEREKCTVLMAVPTIFKMMMEAPEFATTDISNVRWMISGGAPLPLYIAETYQRRGILFKLGYGLTEVGVNCFAISDEDALRKPGSIGKPIMFTEGKLINAEGGEVGPNEICELCLRGDHVCAGYWNNPEATAAALDSEGWWHTGDTARRDEQGFYYVTGRAKDMFISGGVNVYPAEIESELLQHPAVQDAAVIGVPDSKWGDQGVAFIVPRPAQNSLTASDLISFLEGRLARYKVPRDFVFTDALPRTPYGKVVKGELEEKYRVLHSLKAGTVRKE